MPAIADFYTANSYQAPLLNTSATVGTERVWSPDGFVAPGVARWVDRSGGIPVGYPSVHMSMRPPTKNGARVFKFTLKLSIPTLEQTSASTASGIQPAPTKAYDCTVVAEFLLPERSTQAERNILIANFVSLFFGTINASDGAPSDATASIVNGMISTLSAPY